jgi:hypothetical protein
MPKSYRKMEEIVAGMNAYRSELAGCKIQHCHGIDTHLNKAGNKHLRECIRGFLTAGG